VIRIGTRGSALAMAQARLVATALPADSELVVVRTVGDASGRPIRELGDGAFVTALEDGLRAGEVDLAVHSLKDVPTGESDDLVIAAIMPREDSRDVLITAARRGLPSLGQNALVGTSSPRRAAFMRTLRPDVQVTEIRGNVETRMRKVASGEVDATLLALAGLRRLGVPVAEDEILSTEAILPAPGQGALAVQCRASDGALRAALARIDDPPTRLAVETERMLLHELGASCALALGALAIVADGRITLLAGLAADDAVTRVRVSGLDAREVADAAANKLRAVPHAA
jgi:hydroxymethylbilane synthase